MMRFFLFAVINKTFEATTTKIERRNTSRVKNARMKFAISSLKVNSMNSLLEEDIAFYHGYHE